MAVRSEKQLAVLLKLIEVNNVTLTRKNLSVRQKLWQAIAKKLNDLDGAEKDADGWKRSYQSWRFNVGQDYRKELQKVTEDLPDDEYFYINVTEDESEDHVDQPIRKGRKATVKNPTEKQKTRLHELMTKHCEILSSRADDEPLKARIWLNVAEELNAIPRALKLTPREWQERVDWDKYKVRRGRKPSKKPSPSKAEEHEKHNITDCQQNVKDIQFDIIDQTSLDSEDLRDLSGPEYESIEKLTIEKVNAQCVHPTSNSNSASMEQCLSIGCEEDGEIEMLLNDVDELDDFIDSDLVDDISDANDDYESEYKERAKRIKPAPIVKSFKFSQRIVKSVEKLHSDVCDMKELLQKTTSGLVKLEQVMQQQTKQQKLTNALLKRNGQLLKVLVQYKSGRRAYMED